MNEQTSNTGRCVHCPVDVVQQVYPETVGKIIAGEELPDRGEGRVNHCLEYERCRKLALMAVRATAQTFGRSALTLRSLDEWAELSAGLLPQPDLVEDALERGYHEMYRGITTELLRLEGEPHVQRDGE